jgi:hypothetical protein
VEVGSSKRERERLRLRGACGACAEDLLASGEINLMLNLAVEHPDGSIYVALEFG